MNWRLFRYMFILGFSLTNIILIVVDFGIPISLSFPVKGLLFLVSIALAWHAIYALAGMVMEKYEREADTKVPSDNGAEPFGKRDTTAHLINKGRNTRW